MRNIRNQILKVDKLYKMIVQEEVDLIIFLFLKYLILIYQFDELISENRAIYQKIQRYQFGHFLVIQELDN